MRGKRGDPEPNRSGIQIQPRATSGRDKARRRFDLRGRHPWRKLWRQGVRCKKLNYLFLVAPPLLVLVDTGVAFARGWWRTNDSWWAVAGLSVAWLAAVGLATRSARGTRFLERNRGRSALHRQRGPPTIPLPPASTELAGRVEACEPAGEGPASVLVGRSGGPQPDHRADGGRDGPVQCGPRARFPER